MVGLLGLVTDRAIVHPVTDAPERADAIFVLGGAGDRLAVARALYQAGYATEAVLSQPDPGQACPASIPGRLTVTCFRPDPSSTQGEARELATLARRGGWHRVLVVSGHAQVTRARLRVERCWPGQVLVVAAHAPAGLWRRWYEVFYEWGALLKAELWQRSC